MKHFIISPEFPYDRLICSDAGPQYAADMNWPCSTLVDIEQISTPVLIIDNRITPGDMTFLRQIIKARPKQLFALSVTDPFSERQKEPYYDFLFEMTPSRNVIYLSKYHPVELTRTLLQAVGNDRFTVVHYPYVAAKCSVTVSRYRKPRILFSGAFNGSIYPERKCIYEAFRRNLWLRLWVRHLWHPGYPDIGDRLVHHFIGSEYIKLLSSYRFMFLSGSRCELEFLKYRECAYAGCVPVGFPPASFPSTLRDCIVPLDLSRPGYSIGKILRISSDKLNQSASRFAALQAEWRNPERINQSLDAFLLKNLSRVEG